MSDGRPTQSQICHPLYILKARQVLEGSKIGSIVLTHMRVSNIPALKRSERNARGVVPQGAIGLRAWGLMAQGLQVQ